MYKDVVYAEVEIYSSDIADKLIIRETELYLKIHEPHLEKRFT